MSVLHVLRSTAVATAVLFLALSPASAKDEPEKLRDTFVDGSLDLKPPPGARNVVISSSRSSDRTSPP